MEREGVTRVKMFFVITVAYLIFWGPLFLVTLLNWDWEWVDAEKSWAHDVRIIYHLYHFNLYNIIRNSLNLTVVGSKREYFTKVFVDKNMPMYH